ncbi:MAG: hypothetical protein ACKVY0_25415 [Prosthecobacter sp.]|uniref:hypothetical protein n=1 Tax=Prosthecobacter sp. TaxID=1965333 RepID=UPI0038FE4678
MQIKKANKLSRQETRAAVEAEAPPDDALNQEGLPLHRDTAAHAPNLRRTHLTRRHLVISLCTSVVVGLLLMGWFNHFYQHEIAPRLAASARPAQTESTATAALAKADEQIIALQQQVDVMRREQLLMQQNTRESLESIATVLNTPKLAPAPAAPASNQPGVARIPDAAPDISPTHKEFILLKERNRLTAYADEAIATGMRKPIEVLIEYLRDPESKHLHEAAQAEYMRAVRSIQVLQRDDPGYRLPVVELFKDQTIRDEADVKPEALLKLLADYQQPWEVRVRVCFLLLGSTAPETNAHLIKSIKEDPSLEVAKHAQLALEQRVKKRFRIFDIPAIEEWSKSQEK